MDALINLAFSQIGENEQPINDIKYNTWYYGRPVNGAEFPWCSVFISWCADQVSIPTDTIPHTASVRKLRRFFERKGLYHHSNNYYPKRGDILFRQNANLNHVGLIMDITDRGILAIEGNVQNRVVLRAYSLNDKSITGYASPNYKY